MSFGELLAQLVGWLGDFVQFLINFCPRIVWVRWNERGVAYVGGSKPTELKPGLHWWWPWRTKIVTHETTVFTLPLVPVPLETIDGVKVDVGMVVTYQITDILKYEVDNFVPDDNIRETAEGELCAIVKKCTWAELCQGTEEGSRLEGKLSRQMGKALSKFGVTVEGCRPNAMVRLDSAQHVFGIGLHSLGNLSA